MKTLHPYLARVRPKPCNKVRITIFEEVGNVSHFVITTGYETAISGEFDVFVP
jgi:hypothetical protein